MHGGSQNQHRSVHLHLLLSVLIELPPVFESGLALYGPGNGMNGNQIGLVCPLHSQGLHPIAIRCRNQDAPPRVPILAVAPVEWDVDGVSSGGVVFHRLDYRD